MNDLDQRLLTGLTALEDIHLDRLQAHLAAGLPMRMNFGWFRDPDKSDGPACFGCVVGVSMSHREASARDVSPFAPSLLADLAYFHFLEWARQYVPPRETGNYMDDPLPAEALRDLAALAQLEYRRRHPIDVEAAGTCTLDTPTPETGAVVSQPQLVGVGV
jgi:hypothetical protein